MNKLLEYFELYAAFLIYSLCVVLGKTASNYPFFSMEYLFFYGLSLVILGVYAIIWQFLLKRMDLHTAFVNKAVIVIYGAIWGVILFNEAITLKMAIGMIVIMFGIYMLMKDIKNDNGKGVEIE